MPVASDPHTQAVGCEVGAGGGRAVAVEIGGRGAQDAAVGRQPSCGQARPRIAGDADGEVGAGVDQVGEIVRQVDGEIDTGMGLHEARQPGREMHPAEGGGRGDAQRPRDDRRRARHAPLGLVQRGQYAAQIGMEPLARRGQRQPPRGAVNEARAQPLLQPREPLGHHGGRDMQATTGSGEAAFVHDRDEQFMVGVHHIRSPWE